VARAVRRAEEAQRHNIERSMCRLDHAGLQAAFGHRLSHSPTNRSPCSGPSGECSAPCRASSRRDTQRRAGGICPPAWARFQQRLQAFAKVPSENARRHAKRGLAARPRDTDPRAAGPACRNSAESSLGDVLREWGVAQRLLFSFRVCVRT
jgi:hypothetical protein